MSAGSAVQFSDHLIFVDESGDHGLVKLDPSYPVFVLAFCLVRKDDYVKQIVPDLLQLKLDYWGHTEVILHEHELRKPNKQSAFLFDATIRAAFFSRLDQIMTAAPFTLVASVIKKPEYAAQYHNPVNPYELALEFGLERLASELADRGDSSAATHVIVETRGKREDEQLELAFRRIRDAGNYRGGKLPFELIMIPKSSNSTGLQFADLMARPIGLHVMRPTQPNRAYSILETKFRRSPKGKVAGWGLKVFP